MQPKKVIKKSLKKEFDNKPINKNELYLKEIDKLHPERKFWRRKIYHLWDNFYRINFHLNWKETTIVSYFVEVKK